MTQMRVKQLKNEKEKKREAVSNALTSTRGSFTQQEKLPTPKEKVAEQMRSATKPTAAQRATDIGTRVNGATAYGLLTDKEKAARDTGTLSRTQNSSGYRVASGVAAGLSPINKKLGANDTQKQIQNIRNESAGYKGGKIAGEVVSFAIPYVGAAGKVGKVVSKAPVVAKMGKVGQNVAKSVGGPFRKGCGKEHRAQYRNGFSSRRSYRSGKPCN